MQHARNAAGWWVALAMGLACAGVSRAQMRQSVGFETVMGVPIIEVSIGEHGPYKMVLDTGTGGPVIDEALAKELGLAELDPKGKMIVEGQDTAARWSGIPQMRIGELRYENLRAMRLDFTHIRQGLGVEIQGIVGCGVFADQTLTIDYANKRMQVSNESLGDADGRTTFAVVYNHGVPTIHTTFGGRSLNMEIDTGYTGGFRIPGLIARDLPTTRPLVPGNVMANALSVHRSYAGRLVGEEELGGLRFINPTFETTGQDIGVLGAEVLRHYRVSIDGRNFRARLVTTETEPVRLKPMRTLGLIVDMQSRPRKLLGIRPGTEAEKYDLHVGDELIKIEDKPAEQYTKDEMEKLTDQQDRVKVELRRGRAKILVTLGVMTLVE